MMIRAFAAALALCGVLPRPAAAVDLALVLLNDVSRSMDEVEYALVKDGYRAAFADPEVIAALVGNGDGVAVAYVEFSGKDEISQVLDWQVLTDAASRSEEHTSELQSLMRISYAGFCLKKKKKRIHTQ